MIVQAGAPAGRIDDHVSYFLETGKKLSLSDIQKPEYQARFEPTKTSEPDFGYTNKGIWLKIGVRNESARTLDLILVMHTNFMHDMTIWKASDDGAEIILNQDVHSPFRSRPVDYHELAAPFTIERGERSVLYIRYTSEGSTVLPVALETPLSFASTAAHRITVDFAFYGVMAMFILVSFVGRLFWKNPTFVAYAIYAGSVLLYLLQRDGYAFQYLWPNAPVWNNFSSLPVGASLAIFAALFTRVYLQTKSIHPIIDKILIGIIVMQIAIVASALIIGPAEAKKAAVLTTTLAIMIFLSIGIVAYRKYGGRTLFFVIGWLGVLCASFVMTIVHWINVDISRAASLDIMRVAMVFDAFMMGLASVFSIVDLQRDREKLDQERIAALDTNLQLHNRLARLEQKHHLAQTIAETNSQLLVDTTHDLRQPLYALRAAMSEVLAQKAPGERISEIEHSLNYMEELVEAALEKAIEEDEAGRKNDDAESEAIELNKFFSALETMFEADAEKQTADFKVMPTTLRIDGRPFPVLRIMTNFISNAIRYAPGGRVLVGAKRRGDYLSLEVHDTGEGMSAEELAAIRQRYARGAMAEESDSGKGVGLSIVAKLAREENLKWTLESFKGSGTVAKLLVPLARID
ncbi:sensor histidine kinase [Hyphococcus luteus]|uniref:sensor histidine kinase n=1 Tax=Hyphococcus luteus TaxID=2058213 RepID=UPI0013FDC2D5|nr:sensor histidine kinase [Marinicaulis flavus]